jgi:hypothetical protein
MAATEKQFQSRNIPDFKYFSEWLIGHLDKSVDPDKEKRNVCPDSRYKTGRYIHLSG